MASHAIFRSILAEIHRSASRPQTPSEPTLLKLRHSHEQAPPRTVSQHEKVFCIINIQWLQSELVARRSWAFACSTWCLALFAYNVYLV